MNISLGIIKGSIEVRETSEEIKLLFDEIIERNIDDPLKYLNFPSIAGGRKIYRYFKKDPTRYRLSSEALIRRLQKNKDIYRINDVVDLMNYFSVIEGNPIGLYDSDKVEFPVNYRLGKSEEVYKGLGKGELNIQNLPVLCDSIGPFGSSTSDSIRTSVDFETKNIILVIFGFDESIDMKIEKAVDLLMKYSEFILQSSVII